MRSHIQPVIAFLLILAGMQLSFIELASARGGGAANIMASPGYQRALHESRQRYRESYYGQPYTQPPSVYPLKTWRKRGQR